MTKRSSFHGTGITATLTAATLILAMILASGLVACGDDDSGSACEANLLPGDLVITEVLPNPDGDDTGKEWFEVYNATSATIDLRGVTLVYTRSDGTNRKTHLIEAATIGAGEYMVFGGIIEAAMPAYVDYPYGDDFGSLVNSGGRLAIECNSTVVDEMVYLTGDSGVSLSYDGRLVPDAIGNDTITDWCNSETEFVVDNLGTPGAANDQCEGINPTGTCMDGATERDIEAPTAGNVVITELMPDPSAASDGSGEWFEVYFAAAADLNGLQLGKDVGSVDFTVGDANCLPVAAGTYVLFALEGDTALNGGLPPVDVVFDGFSLTNSGGELFVGYGDVELDRITYTSGMVSAGASTSLDSAILDAIQNDDATNWCDGIDVFGGGDMGTPGAANPSCGFVPPDTCIDPNTTNSRAIVPPVMGDVVITEYMANPSAASDANGEWFEVYFAQAADLNGLQIGDSGNPTASTVTSADCIPVTAGSYVVFAREADSLVNGGMTNVTYTPSFSLTNGGTDTIAVGYADTVFDEITCSSVTDGASTSLSLPALDPTQNDNPANWCDSVAPYGDGDLGTPGLENPTCP